LGSGAVFFDLYGLGVLQGRRVLLGDDNADLIGCYQMLRDRPLDVVCALTVLGRQHTADARTCYYRVRDRQFNPARATGRGYTPELAAMLIYLNRTGFNGLFRVNRDGGFNVPMGRYVNPTICDRAHLLSVAAVLGSANVVLTRAPFESLLASAGDGDFVYCDPPYAPLSQTARFANYTAGGFSAADQARLQRAVIAAAERGASIVLSNSSAPQILSLYRSPEAKRVGLIVSLVPARRSINARADARGDVKEVLVTSRHLALAAIAPAKPPAAKITAPAGMARSAARR
jgi:DNA adenine methylase